MVEVPGFTVAKYVKFDNNRVFFEYRHPDGVTDQYLKWLRDGSDMLKKFSDLPKINIDGILVRVGSNYEKDDVT